MKLFNRNVKKKPLTDKAKDERKQKRNHIIKVILDILIYGFAILMAFALAIGGACSPKVKTASAYYHSDAGYTSLSSVNTNTSTTLRYYYDYNYKQTFPRYDTLFDVFANIQESTLVQVHLETPYNIDAVNYSYLGLRKIFDNSVWHYNYFISDSESLPLSHIIDFVTITTNDIIVLRSDILTGIFNGIHSVSVSLSTINNNNWFRYLAYYFGELGYNRITYTFPINISRLAYLLVNTDNTENLIMNGYFFKNDTLPIIEDNNGLYTFVPFFLGSFRCNGVYYSSISVRLASVFGNMLYDDSYYPIKYYMPGYSNIDDYVPSWDEFYKGYWYIDKIYFQNSDVVQEVWTAFEVISSPYGSNDYWSLRFVDKWTGDNAYSSSPYRDLFIYYSASALSGVIAYPFNDMAPQLNGMSFADFLNFIGEAYPTGNTGAPTEPITPFSSVFEWLRIALSGAMPFFGYTIIPGITIGTLVMIPITMSIILFVVKLFKR